MNRKQLLRIIKQIDEECNNLTFDKIDDLSSGDGLYSILEKPLIL